MSDGQKLVMSPFLERITSFVERMSRHFLGHLVGKRKPSKASMFDSFSDLQTEVGYSGARRTLVLR